MTKPILIVGGGPAGLAAAQSLAVVGRKSVLVEKEDRLGGAPILSGYAKLVPTGEWAKDAIGGMVSRAETSKEIDIRKGVTVKAFGGGAETWYRLQAAYDLAQAMKRADEINVERISLAAM